MRSVDIFANVRNPLTRHILLAYYKYYALLLVPILPLVRQSWIYGTGAASLIVLSFVASMALAAALFEFSCRNEIQTLQYFGVPLGRVAMLFGFASLAPQLLGSGIVLCMQPRTSTLFLATLAAACGFLSLTIIVTLTWTWRDAGVVKACLFGIGAQAIAIVAALTLLSLGTATGALGVVLVALLIALRLLFVRRSTAGGVLYRGNEHGTD